MSDPLIVNGVTFDYPEEGDEGWAPDASGWAAAVTQGMLQKAGGSFVLTAEVDFGASFGLKSTYYKSRASNPSSSGQIRLGNTETLAWRNAANNGNVALSVNSSDQFALSGSIIPSATATYDLGVTGALWRDAKFSRNVEVGGDLTVSGSLVFNAVTVNALTVNGDATLGASSSDTLTVEATSTFNTDVTIAGTTTLDTSLSGVVKASSGVLSAASIVDADISNSAAIAVSKLAALTASRAVVTDGSGFVSAATTTATEIGYVSGVTSAIQTQLDGKQATGNYITALTGDVVASGPGSAAAAIQSGVIVNAMVSASAAIAYSKLNLTGSIVNADVSASAAIAGTKISPNFGSQNVLTTGTITGASIIPTSSSVPTNGIYLPAANTVGLAANSTLIATISSAGLTMSQNIAAASGNTYDIGASGARFAALFAQSANLSSQLVVSTYATISSAGAVLLGTSTNNNASAGYIGEYIESVVSSPTGIAASGTYGNFTSISLTAGDWDVDALMSMDANGASITNSFWQMAISVNSGSTTTDHVVGSNVLSCQLGSGSTGVFRSGTVPGYRLSLNATTTVYLKTLCTFSSATPQATARLSARRRR